MDVPLQKLDLFLKKEGIHPKIAILIKDFYVSYQQAISQSPLKNETNLFEKWMQLFIQVIQQPYSFDIFHQSIRQPFDYYQFGLDFIRPFINFQQSEVFGLESLAHIQSQIKKGENIILLANHQTEPDPQVISLLLENLDPTLASNMIFVAGHRVINDPMAIPLSLGRNLLCIYSKKHIAHPPEEKENKILYNQRTLKKMGELLNEGGCCIYVAPSGGRDRADSSGKVDVTPFDPQSVELFWLMAQQVTPLTHFYPLALNTYQLMPPPRQVEKELGEKRTIHFTPVYLSFGEEIDMEHFPESENLDKKTKRHARADYIWKQVKKAYDAFPIKLS